MEEPMKSEGEEIQVALPHEIPQLPKRGRGRPPGPGSKKSKTVHTGKRGRPRKEADPPSPEKPLNQNQDQTPDVSKESTPENLPGTVRRRGRPPKMDKDSIPVKTSEIVRKRGRPPKMSKDLSLVKAPGSESKEVPPNKACRRRGRPRKAPLTPEEEEERRNLKNKSKGPRVWKPLGRPRIYPRVEVPVPSTPVEPKGRGRPRKLKSKKGAHLRKSGPLCNVADPPPLPASSLPRKRGRPPGSTNRKIVLSSTKLESEVQQDMGSPPSTKRSRRSTGKGESIQEPPPSPSHNKREKREKKIEKVTKPFDAGESLPAVSQHKSSARSQPRIASTETAVSEQKEDDDDEEEGSPAVANERTSGPCQMMKKISQGDDIEEERVGKKGSSGRKIAVPKKTKVTKGSRIVKSDQEKTLRGRQAQKNISSIL